MSFEVALRRSLPRRAGPRCSCCSRHYGLTAASCASARLTAEDRAWPCVSSLSARAARWSDSRLRRRAPLIGDSAVMGPCLPEFATDGGLGVRTRRLKRQRVRPRPFPVDGPLRRLRRHDPRFRRHGRFEPKFAVEMDTDAADTYRQLRRPRLRRARSRMFPPGRKSTSSSADRRARASAL